MHIFLPIYKEDAWGFIRHLANVASCQCNRASNQSTDKRKLESCCLLARIKTVLQNHDNILLNSIFMMIIFCSNVLSPRTSTNKHLLYAVVSISWAPMLLISYSSELLLAAVPVLFCNLPPFSWTILTCFWDPSVLLQYTGSLNTLRKRRNKSRSRSGSRWRTGSLWFGLVWFSSVWPLCICYSQVP